MGPGDGQPGGPRRGEPSRRRVLLAAGSAATAGLGGCGAVTRYEFEAAPVVLPPAARASLDFETVHRGSVVTERDREVDGYRVRVAVESRLAVYRSVGGAADGRPASGLPRLGVLSTVPATVGGRPRNRLARRPLGDVLTGDRGGAFLRRTGLGLLGGPGAGRAWARGPALVAERPGTCLGRATTVRSYGGLVGRDPPTAAFVHVTRVAPDGVVLAAGVGGGPVDDPTAPLVGRGGYHSAAGVGARGERMRRAFAALAYDGERRP